jgi:hypothetical protein
MKFKIVTLFFILAFFSCIKEKVPHGILSKEKMVPLLVDLHLTEPIYAQRFTLGIPDSTALDDLYLSFLKKHKVSRKQFEKSVFYYGKHPEQYKEIYNKVLDRLGEMESKIKRENPSIKK